MKDQKYAKAFEEWYGRPKLPEFSGEEVERKRLAWKAWKAGRASYKKLVDGWY